LYENPYQHTVRDTFEKLDLRLLAKIARGILAVVLLVGSEDENSFLLK
jgi:hypothetical protein